MTRSFMLNISRILGVDKNDNTPFTDEESATFNSNLVAEYHKIIEKESNLSSAQRDFITKLYNEAHGE